MNNFTLKQIFDGEGNLAVFSLLNKKYTFSTEQIHSFSAYEVDLFYGDKKIEDLPKDLPEALKVESNIANTLVKDYVMTRLLVANDLFNGWPKKYLLSTGVSEKEIDEKIAQQTKELEEELKAEYEIFPEEENTEEEAVSEPYQPLEIKDARLAVLTTVKDHLGEVCSPTIDFDALILFHNALFDYILAPGQDDVKNIAEIVKVLDENKLPLGDNNLSVAGENVSPTVASWLALFRSKIGAGNWTDTLAIPKFLAGHEAGLLPPAEKIFLGRVLEFYRRLKGYPETLASLQEPDMGFIPALPSVIPAEAGIHSSLRAERSNPVQTKSATPSVIPTKVEGSLGSARDDNRTQSLQTTNYKLPTTPSHQSLIPITQNPPAQSFATQNSGGLQPSSMSDIKPKSEIATPTARNDSSVNNSLLNADEEAELSSHKLSSIQHSTFSIRNSDTVLEQSVNAAASKNGVKFRDEAMQKRFTAAAVMFLKGIRDEMEIREMILKEEASGGLGAPSAIVEPVIKMLKELKNSLSPSFSRRRESIDTNGSRIKSGMTNGEDVVIPKNFDIKNPLKQMLDAEATAAATILPRPEVVKPLPSLPLENGKGKLTSILPLSKGEEKGGGSVQHNNINPSPPSTIPNSIRQLADQNSTPHSMSDVTKPHPLMGGVEEMQYLSLADFRSLGATIEQRVARLSEKFALIKKESLAKFVSAIKAYRASPLFQQYVTLGANSLGQSKTIIQEIAGDTGAGNFLTMEEFDALADFHETLSY